MNDDWYVETDEDMALTDIEERELDYLMKYGGNHET